MYAYTRLEMEMYILYVHTHLCEYIRYYCVIIIRDVLVQHTLQHTHCNTHCKNRYYCVIIIRDVLLVLFRYTHILSQCDSVYTYTMLYYTVKVNTYIKSVILLGSSVYWKVLLILSRYIGIIYVCKCKNIFYMSLMIYTRCQSYPYRVARSHGIPFLQVIFRKRAL